MKLNRKWLLVIALVLSLTMATAGTLAYLTDRDTVENTFTMGNVDIEVEEEYKPDSELNPGVEVEKQAGVKNVHATTDAWVWMTVSVPTDMVPYINLEWLDGTPVDNATRTDVHEGYTSYVVKHPDVLTPGQSTPKYLQGVTLSNTVDYQGGQYGYIEDGVFVPFETMPDPMMIIVDGFAVQTEGFNGVAAAYEAYEDQWGDDDDPNHVCWNGTSDTSWYNETDTEFVLTTAEQLAGLAELVDGGNTFAGKTIKLGNDICLECYDENGGRVSFEPIGDASDADFSGIFDGNDKVISNLYQDCNSKHLGLFGAVYEGTVKNVTLDGARIENDGTGYAGGIAAYAGASNFENITLKNSTVVNYNHNTAGIVAWCSNNGTTTTFDGITIESSTTIGSWWGSYDTRVGGIVGAMNTGNYVVIKDSTVSCCLDVYNDMTSNYQWGNYRVAGMVVADVRDNKTVSGRTEADPQRVTCENVTVTFGDWANYHYCESEAYGTPSYAEEGEYKFRRVEPGLGYGGVDITACDHDADETHNELMQFDFLFGARDGKGIYGISQFPGVTVNYPD